MINSNVISLDNPLSFKKLAVNCFEFENGADISTYLRKHFVQALLKLLRDISVKVTVENCSGLLERRLIIDYVS